MYQAEIKERIKRYFTQPPPLHSAFCFSSRYLSGIHLSPKERRVKSTFSSLLESEAIEPSFAKENIKNAPLLEEKLREGLGKLGLHDKKTACLIPELSLKAFVLSFETLPSSAEEREEIIRFRIKKQIGFLPEDARLSFHQIGSQRSKKLLVSLAREAVIKEYEDLLSRLGLKVRALSSPLFGLFNVLNSGKEDNYLLINIEKDSLSLLAVLDSEIALYRQKPFGFEPEGMESIIHEVENTVHFLEDREKKEIQSLHIRFGSLEAEEDVFSPLEEKWPFPLRRVDIPHVQNLKPKEREVLSPLIGLIL